MTWGRGGIGIRSGLKIRGLRSCGFESHRPYHLMYRQSLSDACRERLKSAQTA